VPNNSRRVEAQLRSASGRSSKLLKDAGSIEAAVKVPGKGSLRLIVHSGGGYSLRANPETDESRDEAAGRDLVALGVLGSEEAVSVVPG
jgi:hypothetical protein